MTTSTNTPERWNGPENDYRGIRKRDPVPGRDVTIIIPVYNRPSLLANTLAGIERQAALPTAVLVVDDGSEEPIEAVVDRFSRSLVICYRLPGLNFNKG